MMAGDWNLKGSGRETRWCDLMVELLAPLPRLYSCRSLPTLRDSSLWCDAAWEGPPMIRLAPDSVTRVTIIGRFRMALSIEHA